MSSKSPRKDESSENKLKRLFSKDKKTVKEKEKGSFQRDLQKEDEMQNATYVGKNEESVSITALLSTSVGVKSRRRKNSNDFKEKKVKPKKAEGEDDKEEGEEAFIFFRPKKGKR